MINTISLDTYIAMKVFGVFRDRAWPLVQRFRKAEYQRQPVWRSLFMSPEKVSKTRSFMLKGVVSPFVCLWPSTAVSWQKNRYARSAVVRNMTFVPAGSPTGEEVTEQGWVFSLTKSFELTASSYYKDFIGAINQDLLELDRLRVLTVNVDELGVGGWHCPFSFEIQDVVTGETLEDTARSFSLGAKYTVSCTVPWLTKTRLLEGVQLYLNDNRIWSTVFDQVSGADHNPSSEVSNVENAKQG